VTTGRDLVAASHRKIGALAAGESLEAQQATDGLAELNRMLSSWSTEGLMGFEVFASPIDLDTEIELPPGYEDAIIYNLSVRLAPEYGKPMRADLVGLAMDSKANVKRSNMTPQIMEVDDALLLLRGTTDILTGDS
jgi:hypothetical protein